MFGQMTVAKLPMSILLPVSSSTCAKDATHLRKMNKTSTVSRCVFGSRQHTRCKTRSRCSGCSISGRGSQRCMDHRFESLRCVAMKRWCILNVSRGSGNSRRNFLSRAASCTGLSSSSVTPVGSRSRESDNSLSLRIFPFLRKTPSIDMSTDLSAGSNLRFIETHPSAASHILHHQ